MDKNVGGLDQGIRITLGPFLLIVAIGSILGSIKLRPSLTAAAAAVGAILTVTGQTQKCPGNAALGRDTFRRGELTDEAQTVRDRAIQ